MLRRFTASILVSAVALLPSFSATAQDWEFVVAPYVLVPSITGDASLGRIEGADVDVSSSDILKSLDLGAMIQVEGRHSSSYGFVLNYAFMDLSNKASGPLGFVDVESNVFQGVLEAFGSRRFSYQGGTVDLYGGLRWWDINLDVEAETPLGSRKFSRNEDWVDPVIGARWMPRVADSLRLLIQGDVGGFGAASDFSWCAMGGLLWDVTPETTVALLYKALGVDYQTGSRGSRSFFEYDTITQGPLLGVAVKF
jgi:hypothetical protein